MAHTYICMTTKRYLSMQNLLLVICILISYCDAAKYSLAEHPDIKVCIVRDTACVSIGSPHLRLKYYQSLYAGCTHIVGNLIVCNLSLMPDGSHPDLSFLHQIRDVTGYVLINKNSINRIALPSLRVIRGVIPCHMRDQDGSLCIGDNMGDLSHGLEILDLRSLSGIQRHNVIISNSPWLCNLQYTIDWRQIFLEPDKQDVLVSNDHGETGGLCQHVQSPRACSHSCQVVNSKSFCWGPDDGMCQLLPKCVTHATHYCMDGRLTNNICHEECLGGCSGRVDNCTACKNAMNDGKCRPSCPPKEIVPPGQSRILPNPDFKYNFHDFCIKDCPQPFLKSNTHCVIECQLTHQMPVDDTCVECTKAGCPENCNASHVFAGRREPHFLDKNSLEKLKNCVFYTGRLLIVQNSFQSKDKSTEPHIPDIKLLWNLHKLRGVVGYIQLDLLGAPPELKNLSFLENLEYTTFEAKYESLGLALSGTPHVQLLGFHSLKKIDGLVKVIQFPHLCYKSALDNIATVDFRDVISEEECERQGHICHSECLPQAGCWGPGSDMCARCCHRRAGSHCISQCTDQPGYYDPSPPRIPSANGGAFVDINQACFPQPAEECAVCHEECAETCYGPGANECKGPCRHFQLNDTCVAFCPWDTFAEEGTRRCLPCHENCQHISSVRACSGPGDHIGVGGCTACWTVLPDSSTRRFHCLKNDCPGKHFTQTQKMRDFIKTEAIPVTPDTELAMATTETSNIIRVCKPCHPFCDVCSANGTHSTICQRCIHWWHQSQCVEHCPPAETYFPQNTSATTEATSEPNSADSGSKAKVTSAESQAIDQRICLPCHKECVQGCSGPNSDDCVKCRNYKVILDEEATKFNCTAECPESQSFELHGTCYTEEEYAIHSGQQARRLRDRIIVSVAAVILLAIVIIAPIIVIWLKRKAEKERSRAKLFSAYTNLGDADTLDNVRKNQLLSREPNMGRLEMINADDLEYDPQAHPLGSGAFGVVYRGVWRVPKAALIRHGCHGDAKLEVAIKVIQNEFPISPGFLSQSSSNRTDTFRDPEEDNRRAIARANIEELLEEAKVMASVEYLHCLPLIGVCLSRERHCLVSAFVELGSLDRYVATHQKDLSSLTMLTWAAQIADGMSYLEMRGIIHRDLAARNVLVQQRDLVQITDFGLAKILERRDQDSVVVQVGRVPIRWLAIETLQDSIYSHKTDVWSYGVTLWEIFTYGRRPYEEVETKDIKDHVVKGGRLMQPDICTLDVYMVMVKCWMEDIESRPTFAELNRTFKKYCQTPGSYLYIPGDVYAVKYQSNVQSGYTLDAHELQPLIPPSAGPLVHRGVPDGSSMSTKENGLFFNRESSPPNFLDSSGTHRDTMRQFTSDSTATTTMDYAQPGIGRATALPAGDTEANGADLLPVRNAPAVGPWSRHRYLRGALTSPTSSTATTPSRSTGQGMFRPRAPLATREQSWATDTMSTVAGANASASMCPTSGWLGDEGYLEPNTPASSGIGSTVSRAPANALQGRAGNPVQRTDAEHAIPPTGGEEEEYLIPKPSKTQARPSGNLPKDGNQFGITNMEYFMQPYFPSTQASSEAVQADTKNPTASSTHDGSTAD